MNRESSSGCGGRPGPGATAAPRAEGPLSLTPSPLQPPRPAPCSAGGPQSPSSRGSLQPCSTERTALPLRCLLRFQTPESLARDPAGLLLAIAGGKSHDEAISGAGSRLGPPTPYFFPLQPPKRGRELPIARRAPVPPHPRLHPAPAGCSGEREPALALEMLPAKGIKPLQKFPLQY